MLFAALVLHPQLVQARCADNVARAVCFSDVVNVAGIMHRMGNIRTVRVALMKRNGNFSALDQREVKAVFITAVRFGEAHRHAFHALFFVITVGIKLHPVHAGCILPGVNVVIFGTGHTRHQRTADHRALFGGRTPAAVLVVRHPLPHYDQGIFATRYIARAGNDNAVVRF